MQCYKKFILPNLVDFACRMQSVKQQREKIVPMAYGTVLEIGVGTGLNFPYYDLTKVNKLWGLEPCQEMARKAKARARSENIRVDFLDSSGEEIPLDSSSIDSVLVTYTLCTIPEVIKALREMARVLKPDGKLIYCEHGKAPDQNIRWWQDWLNPSWQKLSGGCHLNRAIPELIEQGGFKLRETKAMYISGWRPVSYNYWGYASLLDRK